MDENTPNLLSQLSYLKETKDMITNTLELKRTKYR